MNQPQDGTFLHEGTPFVFAGHKPQLDMPSLFTTGNPLAYFDAPTVLSLEASWAMRETVK
jgi:hypothetical protein